MHKAIQLFKIIFRDPIEVIERVLSVVEVKRNASPPRSDYYQPVEWHEALSRLDDCQCPGLSESLAEESLTAFEHEVNTLLHGRRIGSTIPQNFDADPALGRLCYALCRCRRPELVVETGVSHGVTSAYILHALEKNGTGRLVSIDLPPLGADPLRDVGVAVPAILRKRWDLHLGSSRRVLPRVVERYGEIDMFVHDSLHTYQTVRRELSAVVDHLGKGAVVVADDVELNTAFGEWLGSHEAAVGFTVKAQQKRGALVGVTVMSASM